MLLVFLSGVRVTRSFRFLCCAFVFVVVCLVGFSFRSVSCTQCCLFWAVHSGLPLRFSLTFICTQVHVLSIHGNQSKHEEKLKDFKRVSIRVICRRTGYSQTNKDKQWPIKYCTEKVTEQNEPNSKPENNSDAPEG